MTKITSTAEELKCRILSGKYPSGKLPGERELAVELAVGRGTVRAALKVLAEGNMIERRHGAPTLIKIPEKATKNKLACLISRSSGHVYDELYHTLVNAFIEDGFCVQNLSMDSFVGRKELDNSKKKHLKEAVGKLLENNPDAVVMDGYCISRLPLRNKLWSRNSILFNFLDMASLLEEDDPAEKVSLAERPCGVWFDFEAIGYMGGKYLLDRGCRKPLLVTNFIPLRSRLNRKFYIHHRDKLIISGFVKALQERNIDPACSVIDCLSPTQKHHDALLDVIFNIESNLPDGFFGAADFITFKFIKSHMENFGRLPEDIVCLGLGNTPWSNSQSPMPFSSIDFNLKSLSEEIVRMSRRPPSKRKDVYIKPVLIER